MNIKTWQERYDVMAGGCYSAMQAEIDELRSRCAELEQANIVVTSTIPEGYQLMPIEPTRKIFDAMQSSGSMLGNYKAMLRAAKEK
jgi:hypothetical protein